MRAALSAFALGFLALGLFPRSAVAATASASFGVSVTVQSSCLASLNSTAFSTYSAAAANAPSAVSVNCSQFTPYSVGISAGMASGAASVNRALTDAGSALAKYLLNSNYRVVLNRGGQAASAYMLAGSGNNSEQLLSLKGVISEAQPTADSAFGDTVTVIVTY